MNMRSLSSKRKPTKFESTESNKPTVQLWAKESKTFQANLHSVEELEQRFERAERGGLDADTLAGLVDLAENRLQIAHHLILNARASSLGIEAKSRSR